MTVTVSQPALSYRGTDGGAVLSYREHFRRNWPRPGASTGSVVTDLDVFLRLYDADNPTGCFALLEFKYETGPVTPGQTRAYTQIHNLLRSADPDGREYRGAFVVRYTEIDGQFAAQSARPFGSKMVIRFGSNEDFDFYFRRLLTTEVPS
jgi:hypothetical protein